MRKRLAYVLIVELLVAIVLGQMGHVDRRETARAFWEWRQHPTSETRQAFERQKRIGEIQRLVFSSLVFAVLGGGTVLFCRIRGGRPDPGR